MASLLAPVVNATVSKVIVAASEQVNFVVGWKKDLESFRDTLEMLQGMLQDADRRNVISTRSDLKPWLSKLRAIADDADDVFEKVAYKKQRRQLADRKWKKVRYFFTLSNSLLFRLRMGKQVKNFNKRLAVLNANAAQFGLQTRSAMTANVETTVDPPQTNSFPPPLVVGREEDVSKLESLVLDDSTSLLDLPVIAIVGMPGLGKTTLAQAVSKTDTIREKFGENVLWVSVSRDFEPVEILKKMLESVGKSDGVNASNEEAVMRGLQRMLGEKNYLLILDDIWNEERRKWELLRNCLLGASKSNQSRVLVTTRSKDAALIMAGTEDNVLYPAGLHDDECWAIMKQRAFGSCLVPPEVEVIGKKISRKCQGIPLVASLIGATLQNISEKRGWLSVLQNQVWDSLRKESGILDIIRISYDRLPGLALKQCFAFCSIFPKSCVMERDTLIQLWMAAGFLPSSTDCLMEDVGDRYFRCLLSHSLFQEEKRDELGKVTSCKMHDLIHDFAESISNSETVILKEDFKGKIPGHIRHMSVICGGGMVPTVLEDVAPKLQTLFSKHDFAYGVQPYLERLRILCFCNASDMKELQSCFGNSKSLRYLDISGTKLEEFPKFIEKLYNLQTFRFINCWSLEMPPEGLCNLINLRHIYFNDEERMPTNLGRLTNLQTLPLFFVGTTEGCKVEELGSLNKLRGKLEICNLEHVEGKAEAERAKLHEKAVDTLLFNWSVSNEGGSDEDVLEGLRPHPNLQRLDIDGFGGENLSSWMLKSVRGYHFDNLRELKLQECRKLKSFLVMEGFKSLRLLYIECCDELIDCAFAFPSLEELWIRYCAKLETLTIHGLSSLEEFCLYSCGVARIIGDDLSTWSCLKVLNLMYCYNLEFLPSFYGLSSLQDLTIDGNSKLVCLPSGLSSCTALENLQVSCCKSLVSVSEELKELRSLVCLDISDCPKLSSFPEESLRYLTCLKTLNIGGFSDELEEFPDLVSIDNLHASLKRLWLRGWGNLTLAQLPHQIAALTSLTTFGIYDFHGVEVVPEWLGNLTSLTHLSIVRCSKVKSFPDEIFSSLTCLKSLSLGLFSKDLGEYIGLNSIHHLHGSLKELTIMGWEKLTELPHQIQHLTALEKLSLWNFTELEALPDWLGDLPSLQYLYFYFCKIPKHLPSAQLIERLSKLKGLYTYPNWPELQEKIQQLKESTSQI